MRQSALTANPRPRRTLRIAVRAALAIGVALGVAGSSHAGEGKWTLQLEPMYVQVHGHDQHVLTVHEIDLDSTSRVDVKTPVSLDSEDGPAYRFEFQYIRSQWGFGADFFWFDGSQKAADRTAAAGGTIDQVVFEVADRSFTSSDPSEVLLFAVLGDTDLISWTADLYGIRTLAEKPESAIHLQFGLRFGDFDNDYHAVVGLQDVGGVRIDASSNYSLMMGPLVGLAADMHHGRNSLEGFIRQSVLLGNGFLSNRYREFTGPLSGAMPVEVDPATTFSDEQLGKDHDIAIPITEFRLKWTYRISDRISAGLGTHVSAWFDVAVPPGLIPIADGDEVLHENTIVFFGTLAAVKLTF